MLLGTILTLVLTVCADLCFGKGVFSVHHYRHVPVHRNTATVRRVGNVYVFPYYSAMRRKIHRCGYGSYRLGCCAGWVRNSVAGTCTPICEAGCVHGTCVAPNQCRCEPGYRGSNCNADLNECGLEPRPCNHRCINTFGSYRCHCEQGYLLEEDGKTCIRDSRCFPGKCAYGCRKNGLGLECICPAGLEVAKDGYHCLDIDECALGTVRCPSDQRCVNTYGNYMCLCQEGFQFRYVSGKLRCTESEDRCAQAGYVCDSNAKCQAGSGVAKCVCNRGFVGNGEECTAVDLKTCSQRPCFTSVTCSTQELISTDIPYPADGVVKLYECGPCPRGYRGDGETCEDIDECAEGTDACHEEADCVNTRGFYNCVCREGFTGDGFTCFALGCNSPGIVVNGDISPEPNGPNGQYTDGTIITFQCQTGYNLQGSSLSTCLKGMWTAELPVCADINECQTGESACHEHATCLNVPGSYRCTCNSGYTGSGILCFPLYCTVEEPVVNGQVVPPPQVGEEYGDGELVTFICDDGFLLVGSLTSVCEMGLWSNPFPQCVDDDECASSSANDCDVNALCINIPGSHRCECNPGFFGNGQVCIEIDPTTCADGPCAEGVVCTDLDREVVLATIDLKNPTTDVISLYKCGDCPEGYHGDGATCVDIDECTENLFECDTNAQCINLPGTYMCTCNEGYYGDGKVCIPIDPTRCSDLPCFPGTSCNELDRDTVLAAVDIADPPPVIRLYECGECPQGFVGNGSYCEDIDECLLEIDNCDENADCSNARGTFDCVCNRGFYGNGRICIPIDPAQCSDTPCFPGVLCDDLSRGEVVSRIDLDNPPEIILQYECGECPQGYRGDGINCTDIDECAEDLYECHPFAICNNLPGTFECICMDGHHGDGKTCIPMDHTVCTADGPCFQGVDCTNLSRADVLSKIDLGAATPEDIIKFYLCGDCPGGYLGDGEVCLDIDECDTGDYDCHKNASCENEIGGYTCVCVDGHFGNGTHCAQLDDRSCADSPCFPGVECMDIDPTMVDYTQPFVRLFECGECPEDYSGDGIECIKDYIPPFVNLTVIAISHDEPTIDAVAPDVEISAFAADPMSQFGTTKIASAFTGPDGIAMLTVPHNQTLIITASLDGYLPNSVTTKANIKQNNVVTIPLAVFEELNAFRWITTTSNAFAFGGQEGTAQYRVSIPAGALRVRNRRSVQVEFYGVNMTIPEQVEHAPEPIAMLRAGPGPRGDIGTTVNGQPALTELVALDVAGIMELNIFEIGRSGRMVTIVQPVTLNIPVSSPTDEYRVGDSLDAWYYEEDHGVWVKDGTGFIEQDRDSDMLVWRYEATHFTWWAAAKPQGQTSCVKVKTCLDGACDMPVPGVRIKLTGEDYGFSNSRTTDRYAEAYFNFRHGRSVTLEAVCAMETVTVASTTLPAAFENSDADIPSVSLDPLLPSDVCREVTLMLPLLASNLTCPDPGDVEFSSRSLSGIEYSDVVQYTCEMGLIPSFGDGYRTCLECGLWSDQPVECNNIGGSAKKRRRRRSSNQRKHDQLEDYPPESFVEYECGICPPGYRIDGVECTDIDECAEDLYECHPFAMCNNLPGTFECVCMDGHHGDGKTCIALDQTVCTADGPCFQGVDCTNLSRCDVLSKIDLGAATPEDIIKFYLCGDCPGGYLGDGEVCLDIDECDTGDYDCHENASCENVIGGYTCVCVDGHFGNGTHCAQLDDWSCADSPCFPGVECINIDPTMVDYTQPFVRLFECGECPEDYSGDGMECIKDYIPLTVIAISHDEPTIDAVAPDTEISAFVADPLSQFGTTKIASAFTGPDGKAMLSVPHNQTLIITASLDGYLANSVTTKANIKQNNVVTIPLAVFEELNAFRWITTTSNAFAFGGQEGTAQYRVSIPAGALRVRNRRSVQVEFYGVNMTIPEKVEHAPEPIAMLRAALTELVALDVAGIMELNIFEIGRSGRTVSIVQPVTLLIPISSPTNEYRVGDSLDAWYYEEDRGVWVKDGTGYIEQDRDSDMLVWRYEATHFTWWAAAKPQGPTSCVKVKTCLDGGCNMPVPGVRIKLTGKDYGFSTSRTTDRYAEAYFNFRHGRSVILEAVCAMESVAVASTTLPAAFKNAYVDIPSISLDPLLPSEVCREVTLTLPLLASNLTCPDPGENEFSTRTLSGLEYSEVVQYTCERGRIPSFGDGYRTCLECGLWSDQPVECYPIAYI